MALTVESNISALQALETRQSVTANNIANNATKEFKKSTANLEAGPNGSVTSRVQPVSTPGVMITGEDGTMQELSNVDLGEEMTTMASTRNAYQANISAIQTADDMAQTSVDLVG